MLINLALILLGFVLGVAAVVWYSLGIPEDIKKEIDEMIKRKEND